MQIISFSWDTYSHLGQWYRMENSRPVRHYGLKHWKMSIFQHSAHLKIETFSQLTSIEIAWQTPNQRHTDNSHSKIRSNTTNYWLLFTFINLIFRRHFLTIFQTNSNYRKNKFNYCLLFFTHNLNENVFSL